MDGTCDRTQILFTNNLNESMYQVYPECDPLLLDLFTRGIRGINYPGEKWGFGVTLFNHPSSDGNILFFTNLRSRITVCETSSPISESEYFNSTFSFRYQGSLVQMFSWFSRVDSRI